MPACILAADLFTCVFTLAVSRCAGASSSVTDWFAGAFFPEPGWFANASYLAADWFAEACSSTVG